MQRTAFKKEEEKEEKRLSDIIVQKTQTYQFQELCYLEGVSEWRCVQVKHLPSYDSKVHQNYHPLQVL